MRKHVQFHHICLALIAVNALLRLAVAATLPITYKEAYFWEWSRHLAIGYLDHPPMVAWIIATFDFLAPGPSVLTVRLGALTMGLASLALLYRLAIKLFDNTELAYKALLIAICLPLLNAIWTLMLPDGPLIFFQLLAMNIFVSINEKNRAWTWPLLGIAVGLGLMCKITFVLSIAASLAYLMSKDAPPWKPKDLTLATTFALILFSPYLYWNGVQHWAGFKLQLWARHLWNFGFEWGKLAEVLGEQVAAATPILLPLFFIGLFAKTPWPAATRFLKLQMGTVLIFFFVTGSAISQTHPHWTALAFPPAALLLAAMWQNKPKPWLKPTLYTIQGTLAIAMALACAAPQLIMKVDPKWLSGSLERGLIKGRQRLLGFEGLEPQLQKVLTAHQLDPNTPIMTNSYQIAGPLSFALSKQPVICLDAFTSPYPTMGHAQPFYLELEDKPALFLARNSGAEARLRAEFPQVVELEPLEQIYDGEVIGEYRVYLVLPKACAQAGGPAPQTPR